MKLAAAFLSCIALPAVACPLPAPSMQKGDIQATWEIDGAPITVGQHFAIKVRLCPADAVLTRVNASMPAHRHGMNYRPSVQSLGQGRWHVEGMMFHMPGLWELQFDVQTAERTEQLRDPISLP